MDLSSVPNGFGLRNIAIRMVSEVRTEGLFTRPLATAELNDERSIVRVILGWENDDESQ